MSTNVKQVCGSLIFHDQSIKEFVPLERTQSLGPAYAAIDQFAAQGREGRHQAIPNKPAKSKFHIDSIQNFPLEHLV